MAKTRREFLYSSAALAAGLAGTSAAGGAQSGGASPAQPAGGAIVDDKTPKVQVPLMKFAGVEISRLVMGCNPFNGGAHFNGTYGKWMQEWYTAERVSEVLHRANGFGINAMNFTTKGHTPDGWTRLVAEGGAMHLIAHDSTDEDPAAVVKKWRPLSLHRQGEIVDVAFREGKMAQVREWCKKVRATGVPTGVATHNPEVIDLVESEGWDIDYYAGCVYHRSRNDEEWRQVLHGVLMEMPREIYLQSDPARMYKAIRQTAKPCFAFKILAAGRIADGGIEKAFRTAFTSIKPIDGVFVGMFPRDKDQVRQNAEMAHRVLAGA